jgi:predicted RNase H-like HicB family nuclease
MARYPARLTKDGSSILVTFRDVPETITFGKNKREALERAVGALEIGLSFYIDSGKDWPEPSAVIDGKYLVLLLR